MGFSELVIVLLVALIVFGPEHLPSLARGMGRCVAKLRGASEFLQAEIDKQIKLEDLKDNIAKAEAAEKDASHV